MLVTDWSDLDDFTGRLQRGCPQGGCEVRHAPVDAGRSRPGGHRPTPSASVGHSDEHDRRRLLRYRRTA